MAWIHELARLQERYQEMKDACRESREIVAGLHEDYLNAESESERRRWKKRLIAAQQDLEELEEQRESLAFHMERNPLQMVFEKFLNLDYVEHIQQFEEFLAQEHGGVFMLHGDAKHGLSLFVKRILFYLTERTGGLLFPIKINIATLQQCYRRRTVSAEFSVDLLWREIGKTFECSVSPDDVVEKIYQKCREQHVALVFDGIDITGNFQAVIQEFWQRLFGMVQEQSPSANHSLLLLLIVREEYEYTHEFIDIQEAFDASWSPTIPVKLPSVGRYLRKDVENWRQMVCCHSPIYHKRCPPETLDAIFDGQPYASSDVVLEQLCAHLGQCDFQEGVFEEWLRI